MAQIKVPQVHRVLLEYFKWTIPKEAQLQQDLQKK